MFINRDEVWEGVHCEYYQLSKGMRVVYNRATHALEEFSLNGKPIEDDRVYRVGLQSFQKSVQSVQCAHLLTVVPWSHIVIITHYGPNYHRIMIISRIV